MSTGGIAAATTVLLALSASLGGAEDASAEIPFGTVVSGGGTLAPIRWESANGMALGDGQLRLSVPPGQQAAFRTRALGLQPLAMYGITLTTQRGPGTRVRMAIRYRDERGTDQRRDLALQLPDTPRASHLDLSPYRQTYAQNVCLPPSATECSLEVSLEGHAEANFNDLALLDLTIRQGASVPFGRGRGENLIPAGAMEIPGKDGVPVGWGTWGYPHPPLELPSENPQQGNACLRVSPGVRFYLPSATAVPVEVGHGYELHFWARGKGDIQFLAHPLAKSPWYPIPLRVGDPQSRNVKVDSVEWTRFTQVWFAESPHVETAEVVFVIAPEGDLFLDGVEFRLIRAEP